jgi:integrase
MSTADPIRKKEEIEKIKDYFLKNQRWRDYVLFTLGINTSLRISDLLFLRWKDVYDFEHGKFLDHIQLIEKKTLKTTTIALNSNAINALQILMDTIIECSPMHFIIKSREGENRPIHRSRAFSIIKKAAHETGVNGTICCHSLRKTFGYHAWKKGVPPAVIMDIYNHSSMEITKIYLSINQDDKDEVFLNLLL